MPDTDTTPHLPTPEAQPVASNPQANAADAAHANAASTAPAAPKPQKHNPLHGITLEAMVTALSEYYGWPGLADRIPVRCFAVDPSVPSSLKFLRKTPWARDKVESLYLFMLRDQRRAAQR